MMNTLKHGLRLVVVAAGLALLVWLFGYLVSPDFEQGAPTYTPEQLAEVRAARKMAFDPTQTPSLHVDERVVPTGESSVLAELVAEGVLPPLAQRLPKEPVVMRGVDGIGRYGGTWLRVATSPGDVSVIANRMSYTGLVRWSPMGYPIEPHVAKAVTASADKRVWTVQLREGLRWSDGEPFTSADIMFWWENVATAPDVARPPDWMHVQGKAGTVEAPDAFTVRFVFPEPYGAFLEVLAVRGQMITDYPAHYLRPYHPDLGDPAFIAEQMAAYQLPSPRALFGYIRQFQNPEHPRLWPWIYRQYRPTAPQVFVRNPYYFAVDPEGNQLPYVDRLQFDVQDAKLLAINAANGNLSMQARHLRYENYTELMSRRGVAQTRVLHWYPATRSNYVISPNANRRIVEGQPDTKWKAQLLAEPQFRKALSLAIDRDAIIRAEYNAQVQAAQVSPGAQSPFHHEALAKAYTEHAPGRAEVMLDGLGLTGRDADGFRTFPDGSPMVFYLDYCAFTGAGPAQFIVEDWANVGVRAIPREQSRPLFYTQKNARAFDFKVWTSESDYLPLLSPRVFVPDSTEALYGVGWGRWFMRGGYFGSDEAQMPGAVAPPSDHPIHRSMQAYVEALSAPDAETQRAAFLPAMEVAAEQLWTISIAEAPPQPVVVKQGFRNVPPVAMSGYIFSTPGNAGIETYYFEDPVMSPGAVAELKQSLTRATPLPGTLVRGSTEPTGPGLGTVVRWLLVAIAVGLVLMLAVRHPYIGRRLMIMVPTLIVISIIVFTIIQLPPGDFLATRIMQLQESGDQVDLQQIEDLRKLFHFEEPMVQRYLRWMGVMWFFSFEEEDKGLLQGEMGRSMETTERVNEIVGDRIVLTMAISICTVLFTWATAIPIGIYSAVRQYSRSDYALTLIGFVGMSIPPFLLALILMAMSGVSGLFSPEYAAMPEWTPGKVVDLLKHIWIPVVVLGVGGTAGMIRVMRANLLDELNKPYVITAMAKGVGPLKLLLKYPVRVALNPFVSGIGHLFPQIVSGGAIVAMVLALPTVGPLLLSALFGEDMYLAGSMLMVLSLLGVLGTLVSDLLLLWLDPRIRFEGGSR